jgi:hypothetical protein
LFGALRDPPPHRSSALRARHQPFAWAPATHSWDDLVDHLFNSSEKRLARTLLLLARYRKEDLTPTRAAQAVSGDIGRDGRYEYNGGLKVNSSFLSIVLHD